MGTLSSFNRCMKYLLYLVNVSANYTLLKPLANKKGLTILDDFIGIVNKSKRKPYKLWINQEKQFYSNFMQKWLEDNVLMYLKHNKATSVVAEIFIRTLNDRIYKKWWHIRVVFTLII